MIPSCGITVPLYAVTVAVEILGAAVSGGGSTRVKVWVSGAAFVLPAASWNVEAAMVTVMSPVFVDDVMLKVYLVSVIDSKLVGGSVIPVGPVTVMSSTVKPVTVSEKVSV